MRLIDLVVKKLLLPQDRKRIACRKLYIERTYAGCNQKAAGAWSAVIRDEDDVIFTLGCYESLSQAVKARLLTISSCGYTGESTLESVNTCRECPHYRESRGCLVDDNNECPLREKSNE